MANIKEIDWDKIRAYYVTSQSYPSYDDLAKKFGVSKTLIINMANDKSHSINQGKTWIEQRNSFAKKKQKMSDTVAANLHKGIVKNIIMEMDEITKKAFTLVSNDLDEMLKEQKRCQDAGEKYNAGRYIRISDITKLAETMVKITTPESKEADGKLVIEFKNKKAQSLEDLSDDELEQLEYQAETGLIVDNESD